MSRKITDKVFPYKCSHKQCEFVYSLENFIELALFWGFILLENHSDCYFGFTCPRCMKTTINKIPGMAGEQVLTQLESAGIDVGKRYRGVHPKFRCYLLFSSEGSEEVDGQDRDVNLFTLPGGASPLTIGVKENQYPIAEHDILLLANKENSENTKFFPRIVNFNSVYKHTDLILKTHLNPFSILKKLLFSQYGELCAWKKDSEYYQPSVYDHIPDVFTTEYFERIFGAIDDLRIRNDNQNRLIVDTYKSVRNRLDFEIIYKEAFLHSLANALFFTAPDADVAGVSGGDDINEALYAIEEKFSSLKQILTRNAGMMEIKHRLSEIAGFDTDVLLIGQTGTGKELFARAIHQISGRTGVFVPINCSSIPNDLFEKELFGSVKGAFTGAVSDHDGAFLLAQNGTLFLDEFGELPLDMQPKILRAIENREIRLLGSENMIHVDVKIVFATNRDLDQAVEKGSFRRDLYFRIKSPVFHLPPLSERIEDIPLLADYFREIFNEKYNKAVTELSPELLSELKKKPWDGNVRELMKAMEMIILNTKGSVAYAPDAPPAPPLERNNDYSSRITDEEIRYWMKKMNNNKSQVARKLGVSYRTILRRSKKLL